MSLVYDSNKLVFKKEVLQTLQPIYNTKKKWTKKQDKKCWIELLKGKGKGMYLCSQ